MGIPLNEEQLGSSLAGKVLGLELTFALFISSVDFGSWSQDKHHDKFDNSYVRKQGIDPMADIFTPAMLHSFFNLLSVIASYILQTIIRHSDHVHGKHE